MMKRPLALYLHIPFCAAKCAYCDFASYPGREDVWEEYTNLLSGELRAWKEELSEYEAATVFFGGGTPSLIPAEKIARLMDNVRSCVDVRADAEVTIESNPGTLTKEKLRLYRGSGINRISIGAQAMDDRLLRALGRIHTSDQVCEAVSMAREAGFENLSLDLMYALPEQSADDWMKTLERAVRLQPEHLSAYSLIVEEGTPMAGRVESGAAVVPDDDAVVEMQRTAVQYLAEAGYHRYEISNYAKDGCECRHNIVYWQRGEYLGVGCAAHSMMKETRFENPRSLKEYLSGVRKLDVTPLTREDAMEETLMLSTRMCRGLDLAAWQRNFGEDFAAKRAKKLAQLEKMGLVRIADGFMQLTRTGLELQNAVVVELMDE